jgi:hypothetical protein
MKKGRIAFAERIREVEVHCHFAGIEIVWNSAERNELRIEKLNVVDGQ